MSTILKITFKGSLYFKQYIQNKNWFALTLVILVLSSCKDDDKTANPFPVNETFLMQLTNRGIPLDVAQFFAAARMEVSCPNDTTCIYLQTFPNGATREMTLKVRPNLQYTPTLDEIANTSPGTSPIYDFNYASSIWPDNSTHTDMTYFVPKSGLPLKKEALMQIKSGAGDSDGAGISWGEIGKTGADVSIGTLIDYAKANGTKVGSLASIYALASALSAVTGALDMSKQNTKWLAELDALEECAANPTSLLAKSDPNYSANAVAKIQNARDELKQVNSVRFLNSMTETGAGITPATAVLSVGLKEGFVWSEQTLRDYSENTIMREARLAIVPCGAQDALDGNIDVVWDCTSTMGDQVDHEVIHTISKVKWVFSPTERLYVSQGSYTFDYKKTSTYKGKTCVDTKASAGSLTGTGRLLVIDDVNAQNVLGYSYMATGAVETNVAASYSCGGASSMEPYTISWCPEITGFSNGGLYRGEVVNPSCIGNSSTGTETIKWAFSIASAK